MVNSRFGADEVLTHGPQIEKELWDWQDNFRRAQVLLEVQRAIRLIVKSIVQASPESKRKGSKNSLWYSWETEAERRPIFSRKNASENIYRVSKYRLTVSIVRISEAGNSCVC